MTGVRRLVGALLIAATAGCAGTTSYEFPEDVAERFEPLGPVLLVAPVQDGRSGEPRGSLARALIPGIFTSRAEYPHPEEDPSLDLDVPDALRKSLARLGSESLLFSQVVYDRSEIQEASRVVVLDARVTELSLEVEWMTYGVGPLGWIIWVLGFPSGEMATSLEVDLNLSTSLGAPLWQGKLRDERARLRGLYFNRNWREHLVEDLTRILRWKWRDIAKDFQIIVRQPR